MVIQSLKGTAEKIENSIHRAGVCEDFAEEFKMQLLLTVLKLNNSLIINNNSPPLYK